MSAEVVTFINEPAANEIKARVFVRSAWFESWTEVPGLYPLELVWATSPTMPTAKFEYYYGMVMRPDYPTVLHQLKQSLVNKYVKVILQYGNISGGDYQTRYWYGIIVESEDEVGGSVSAENDDTLGPLNVATGIQTFKAYGLEWAFKQQEILYGFWSQLQYTGVRTTRVPPVFNKNGKPNKNSESDPPTFALYETGAEHWSTYDIVTYLLKRCCVTDVLFQDNPEDAADVFIVTYDYTRNQIPDWDTPEDFSVEGSNLYDALTRLINTRRLLTWYLETTPNNPGTPTGNSDTVTFKVASVLPTALELDAEVTGEQAVTLSANEKLWDLRFDTDPMTDCTIVSSEEERCDQVIIRGDLRRSVVTLKFGDDNITYGWDTSLMTDYSSGVEDHADWNANPNGNYALAEEYRKAPKFAGVFTTWQIPITWNGIAPAGGTSQWPAFPNDTGIEIDGEVSDIYLPYMADVVIDPQLPLLEGIDYTDVSNHDLLSEAPELSPMCFVKDLYTETYRLSDTVGATKELPNDPLGKETDLSLSLSVVPHTRTVLLKGGTPHAVDSAEILFTPLDLVDDGYAVYDFRDFLFTVCLVEPRYTEGAWPEDPWDDSTGAELADMIGRVFRVKVIYAPGFRCDWVGHDTVVGVDPDDGSLIRSEGGYLIDQRKQLTNGAKVAYEYYGRTRHNVRLITRRALDLSIGQLVQYVGTPNEDALGVEQGHRLECNSVITQMAIALPTSLQGSKPMPPQIIYTTDHGELDVLQFIGKPRRKRLMRQRVR